MAQTPTQTKSWAKIVNSVSNSSLDSPSDMSLAFAHRSAGGDDRSLASHGIDLHYWYSIADGMRLLAGIREGLQDSSASSTASSTPSLEALYSPHKENIHNIFVSDPYFDTNFGIYLKDDVSKIIATDNFAGTSTKWQTIPSTIIIPILSGAHWRAVKIDINYKTNAVNILFDDPYGTGCFSGSLKNSIVGAVRSEIPKLFKTQEHYKAQGASASAAGLDVPNALEITVSEKAIDQQGRGHNSWDCGPIIFSNIRDYVKQTLDHSECTYSIPDAAHKGKESMAIIRAQDIEIYSRVAGILLDNKRVQDLRKEVVCDNESKTNSSLNVSSGKMLKASMVQPIDEVSAKSIEIATMDPFLISMIFTVLENKRLLDGKDIGKQYTQEDLDYAYNVIMKEASYSKKKVAVTTEKDEVKADNSTDSLSDAEEISDTEYPQSDLSILDKVTESLPNDSSVLAFTDQEEKSKGSDHAAQTFTHSQDSAPTIKDQEANVKSHASYEAALAKFEKSVTAARTDSTKFRAYMNKAKTLNKLEKYDDAEQDIDAALRLGLSQEEKLLANDIKSTALTGQGLALYEIGKYEAALPKLEESVAVAHTDSIKFRACIHNAKTLNELSRYDDAIVITEEAGCYTDKQAEVQLLQEIQAIAFSEKGEAAFSQDAFHKALSLYNTALKLSPTTAKYHINKAKALNALNRYDDTISAADDAVHHNPSPKEEIEANDIKSTALSAQGLKLYNEKKYGAALSKFADSVAAAQTDPTKFIAYINKAKALNELHKYKDVIVATTKAGRYAPEQAENQLLKEIQAIAYNGEGDRVFNKKNFPLALDLCNEAIKRSPTTAKYHIDKAKVLNALAITAVDEAMSPNPSLEEGLLASDIKSTELSAQGLKLYNEKKYGAALIKFDQSIATAQTAATKFIAYNNKAKVLNVLAITAADAAIGCNHTPKEEEEANDIKSTALVAQGLKLYNEKEYEAALVKFDDAIQIDATKASAYINKAKVLNALKRYDDAITAADDAMSHSHSLEEGISANDIKSTALSAQGLKLSNEKNNEAAFMKFAESVAAAQTDPIKFNACINKAKALNELKYYDEAIIVAEEAVNYTQNQAEIQSLEEIQAIAFSAKGEDAFSQGAFHKALSLYNTALKLLPTSAEYHMNKAKTLNELGRYDEALMAADEAMRHNHNSKETLLVNDIESTAFNGQGSVFHKAGSIVSYGASNQAAALEKFEASIAVARTDSTKFRAYINKAKALNALDRYDEAIVTTNKAKSYDPDRVEIELLQAAALNGKGDIAFNQNRHMKALWLYNTAIKLSPTTEKYHINKAKALNELHKYDEAIIAADEAMRHNLSQEMLLLAYDIKSTALSGQGFTLYDTAAHDYPTALVKFEESVLVARTDSIKFRACINKAKALNKLNRYNDAIIAADEAMRYSHSPKEEAEANDIKSNALSSLGLNEMDNNVALSKFEESVAVAQTDPIKFEAYINKAKTLNKLSRYDAAIIIAKETEYYAHSQAEIQSLKEVQAGIFSDKGDAAFAQNTYHEALALYNTAIKLSPTTAKYHINKAKTLYVLHHYDKVITAVEVAISHNPSPEDGLLANDIKSSALVAQGLALYDADKHAEALEKFGESLVAARIDATKVIAYTSKAKVLNKLERYDEAIKAVTEARGCNPVAEQGQKINEIEFIALFGQGLVLHKPDSYEDALAKFDAAIQIDVTKAIAYINKAKTLNALNRYDLAIIAADEAMRYNHTPKEEEEVNDIKSTTLSAQGLALYDVDNNAALPKFDQSIATAQTAATKFIAYSNKAKVLNALNTHDDAIIAVDEAIKHKSSPEDELLANDIKSIILSAQGLALYDVDNNAALLKFVESVEAARTDSIKVTAYVNKAKALNKLKLYEEATIIAKEAEHYTKSQDEIQSLKEVQAVTFSGKGNAAFTHTAYYKALSLYNTALKLSPTTVKYHINKAKALTKLSRYDDVITAADDAMRHMPSPAEEVEANDIKSTALSIQGLALYNAGGYEAALVKFDASVVAARTDSIKVTAYINKAKALTKLEQLEKYDEVLIAIDEANRCNLSAEQNQEIKEIKFTALLEQGLMLHEKGSHGETITKFDAAIEINDAKAITYIYKAKAKAKDVGKDYQGTIDAANEALNHNPTPKEEEEANDIKSTALSAQGLADAFVPDYQAALVKFEASVEAARTDSIKVTAYTNKAKTLHALNQNVAAIIVADEAMRHNPTPKEREEANDIKSAALSAQGIVLYDAAVPDYQAALVKFKESVGSGIKTKGTYRPHFS